MNDYPNQNGFPTGEPEQNPNGTAGHPMSDQTPSGQPDGTSPAQETAGFGGYHDASNGQNAQPSGEYGQPGTEQTNWNYNSGSQQPYNQGRPPEYQWNFEDYDALSHGAPAVKPKSNTGLKVFAIIITIVFILTVTVFAAYVFSNRNNNTPSANGSLPSDNSQNEQLPDTSRPSLNINPYNGTDGTGDTYGDGGLSTEDIAAKVRPSVVGIVTYAESNPFQASSSGSGIIMSSDGYILTNAHVVSGAYGIVVVLDNDEEYEAQVVGIDEKTDIAVIKIEAENLTAAEFGDSEALRVGERVVAIGNPTGLNLAGSTTQGIISGLQRSITIENDDGSTITMEVIQTDAAINPGNSGGALINKYGQVIGINSSKLVSTQLEGIGFAIPISTAKPIVDDLVQYGYVTGRVLLGITYYPISSVVAAMYNYPTAGLLVNGVDQTLDVYTKGVRAGDIITHIDGLEVQDTETVQGIFAEKNPGDIITLTIYRQSVTGKATTFNVDVELSEDKGNTNTGSYSQQAPEDENNSSESGEGNFTLPFQRP